MKKVLIISVISMLSASVFANVDLLSTNKEIPMAVQLPENNSNFIGQIYNDHNCLQPMGIVKPIIEEENRTNDMISKYNIEIEQYNKDIKGFKEDAKNYIECISLYSERGKSDMNVIKTKIESSINEANKFIKIYQK